MNEIVFFLIAEGFRLLGVFLAGLLAAGAFWLAVELDNETLIQNRASGSDCAPWLFAGKGGKQ